MPYDPNDPNAPPDPNAGYVESAPSQPQPQAPTPDPNAGFVESAPSQPQGPPVTAQPGALKGLLTNFFGGMGRAMMVHAGLPTPEQEQQRQQQQQMQQQANLATIQYHQASADALRKANEVVPYQLPDNPDGTPGQVIPMLQKSIGPLAAKQMQLKQNAQIQALNAQLKARGIGGQIANNPQTGEPEFQPITDQSQLTLPQQAMIQQKQQGKPVRVQYDQGIPVSVSDAQGNVYDVNDPNLPKELQPLRQAALNAHRQHVTEQAEIQARAFGQQVKMNEVRQANLTNSTKTMIEAAPRVINFVDKIDKLVDAQKNQLGPAAGRWNEFMTGKVGAPNPDFAKLRTDVGLMTTLLMRMHVGARGGEYIMKHFQDLVDSGKQSPENMKAALGEIKQYAQEVQSEAPAGSPAAAQAPTSGTIRVQLPDGRTGTVPASSRSKYESMPGAKILQ